MTAQGRKSCAPKQTASKKLRCDSTGFQPQVLDYVRQSLWRKATGTSKLLSELGQLAKTAWTKTPFRRRPRASKCARNHGKMLKIRRRRGTIRCFCSLKLQPFSCKWAFIHSFGALTSDLIHRNVLKHKGRYRRRNPGYTLSVE